MPSDRYWSNVSLLLKGEGSDGGTTHTDSSSNPKTITNNGSVTTEVEQFKFGSSSILFNSSAKSLTVASHADFALAGDFTIEFSVYLLDNTGLQGVFNIGAYNTGIMFRLTSTYLDIYILGTQYTFSTTINASTWYTIALTRKDGMLRGFNNGTLLGSVSAGAAIPQNAITIGYSAHTSSEYVKGYIDELRLTKDKARYTASYAIATETFPTQAAVFAGNITETFNITDWRVSAKEINSELVVGSQLVTGSSYSFAASTDTHCILYIEPRIDYGWEANKVAALGDFVIPSDPDTTQKIYEVTTAGAFGATESAWNPSGTTTQGTAVLTFVADLDDGMFKILGPKLPV